MHLLFHVKKNCFSIISSNIQSINANFSGLEAFVEELKAENVQFSVICLQESISKKDDFSHIQLDGYNCITQGKTSSKKGRLIIYAIKIDIRSDSKSKQL